jgi:oxygen-independent coproporphyrinogen-3 oxidase
MSVNQKALPNGRGLYVHVPFCARKCLYCDFYSITQPCGPKGEDLQGSFVQAVLREATLWRKETQAEGGERPPHAFTSFYLGGGSPSQLSATALTTLVGGLEKQLNIDAEAERTIEVNPADVTRAKSALWRDLGFNRYSLGIQSFDEGVLARLGRRHDKTTARRAIERLRRVGSFNLGLDLIYGLVGKTAVWEKDLREAVSIAPDHLSLYELTLSSATPLGRRARSGAAVKESEEVCADLYWMAHGTLARAGYIHYEVSNYACGLQRRCKHNLLYWSFDPYLGLGPGAHSYDGRRTRWWNGADLDAYLSALHNGEKPPRNSEHLDDEQRTLERLALGFRTTSGVARSWFEGFEGGRKAVDRFVAQGLLEVSDDTVRATSQGMLLADGLAREMAALQAGDDPSEP